MLKILIIEDDAVFIHVLKMLIHDLDKSFVIDTAESVKSALQKIKLNKYDLILLDRKLPDGSGIEITKKSGKNKGLINTR